MLSQERSRNETTVSDLEGGRQSTGTSQFMGENKSSVATRTAATNLHYYILLQRRNEFPYHELLHRPPDDSASITCSQVRAPPSTAQFSHKGGKEINNGNHVYNLAGQHGKLNLDHWKILISSFLPFLRTPCRSPANPLGSGLILPQTRNNGKGERREKKKKRVYTS
jgi:hypothetical protein